MIILSKMRMVEMVPQLSILLLSISSPVSSFSPTFGRLSRAMAPLEKDLPPPFVTSSSFKVKLTMVDDRFTDTLWADTEVGNEFQKEWDDMIEDFEKNTSKATIISRVKGAVEKIEKKIENKIGIEKDKDPVIFAHPPEKDMTGVHPEITKLCSTISAQLYEKESIEDFQLSTKSVTTEVIVYDDHGTFSQTSPPFCAAIVTRKDEKYMILGWRGTSSLGDILNDAAASPQSSLAWRKHGEVIKAQGAMTGIVHNDITNHEEAIIENVKKEGIKEIITTGQSLGGGCAQIAHLTLRAQIEDESSPWNELEDVNIRSVNFCAPMTTVLVKPANDALVPVETDAFIEKLFSNSCNIVYENDVVPRGYRDVGFVGEFLLDAVKDIESSELVVGSLETLMLEKFINRHRPTEPEILKAFYQYRHVGNVIFYKNPNATPEVLNNAEFLKIKYEQPELGKNRIEEMMRWHMQPIQGPGLSYPDDQLIGLKGEDEDKNEPSSFDWKGLFKNIFGM